MCSLPSANVARTCRTMESPTITASHSVSQRGTKRLRVEISKNGGGGDIVHGLDCFFRCCIQGLWFPGAGVKDIWEDRVPGARGLCRKTHGVEVVGVLAAGCILTPNLWRQPGMFPALLSAPSAGPASQEACGSVSPWPPAPAAPNAARRCPQLHSKVDTNPPLKQVTAKQW